jgi:uncharacterized protein
MGVMVPLEALTGAGSTSARALPERFQASAPRSAAIHVFRVADAPHALVPDGSRIYRLTDESAAAIESGLEADDLERTLEGLGLGAAGFIGAEPPAELPVRSLSLAVAQKCNLGCIYCYAQEGSFGDTPRSMPLEVALQAVDRLFEEADPRERLTLAFLGGEPLTNRPVIQETVRYARKRAAQSGVAIQFSITTNGTLLTPADGDFFEEHGFAVTVSLDGVGEAHDRQRPFQGGRGSYARILERVRPLLERQRRMQVSARVTVTPANLALRETLEELLGLGFASVGFSPMLASPTGRGEMHFEDLARMLERMIECGLATERHILAGERYPFSNLVTALRELHKGTHRPYPCGAGGSYFGVSADGDLAACHRFVNDPAGAMGSLAEGLDRPSQQRWLEARHVDRQEPCRSCWARYLCGGSCHHEAIHRGRPACHYIRGWLDYCLGAYIRLLELRPDYFTAPDGGHGS